jgi:hypothetical protein
MPRTRGALAITGAAFAVGPVAALVFLVRAGDPGSANWPVTWELRSSDNGVLFQLLQDVVAGQPLDWTFSPQVYVVPELPISALAFALAGGNLYGYYLAVAVLNTVLLFLALLMLARVLRPADGIGSAIGRAALASTPLVVLPLIGTSWLVAYHLAPTYYIGMYLMVIVAPAVFLVRATWARVVLGALVALTAAANPLGLVFAFPAFVVVLLLLGMRRGFRTLARPAALAGAVLGLAIIVRLLLFGRLQGASPLSYVDTEVFAGRLRALGPYFDYLAFDPAMRVILTLGAVLAVGCAAGAVVAAVRYLRGRGTAERMLVAVYLGLVPLAGLAGTYVLMITHYLYFWLVLIAPFAFALFAVPPRWAARVLPAAGAALVVTALVTGAVPNLAQPDRFFGYRSPETRCLDDNLPPGTGLGYGTFSDGRRVGLTSLTPFRFIQIRPDGASTHEWLTNLAIPHTRGGTFFYLNAHGDEPAIDRDFVESTFGTPDAEFDCGEGQTVLVYSDSRKLAAIAEYYRTARDPILGGER